MAASNALRIAGVEAGVVQPGLQGDDLVGEPRHRRFQRLQPALVLVGELLAARGAARRRWRRLAWRLGRASGRPRAASKKPGFWRDEVAPAARRLDDVAGAVQRDGRGRQPVDEVAVVADQDQGAVVVGQHLFQQVQRLHVEVVGGLVEHQQVGGAGQRPGQQQPVALAAGEAGHRLAQLAVAGTGSPWRRRPRAWAARAPSPGRRRPAPAPRTGSCRPSRSTRAWST